MTDTPRDPYFEAYGRTEEALIRIAGLVHGLYELATEHPGLNNPEPMSNAILSMIVCIEEKATEAQAAHEAEHKAHHGRAGEAA
jgi:hypothetical protein